jgi:hypothetical protein
MYRHITVNEIYAGFKNGNDHGDNRILVVIGMLVWDALYGFCAAISALFKKKEA